MQTGRRFTCALLVGVVLMSAGLAGAEEVEQEGIEVHHPWARPTPPVSPINGAVYFSVTNHRDEPIRLEAVQAPWTAHASLHQSRQKGGTVRMEVVDGGVLIGPGETMRFEPNGYHVMLMDLTDPLKEGDRFPMTLEFRGESVDIEVQVRQVPARESEADEPSQN